MPPATEPDIQAWALDHWLTVLAQTESRPGPLTDEDERWMERRHTGKAMAVCTCGRSSGLIDRADQERTVAELQHTEHAPTATQTLRSEG